MSFRRSARAVNLILAFVALLVLLVWPGLVWLDTLRHENFRRLQEEDTRALARAIETKLLQRHQGVTRILAEEDEVRAGAMGVTKPDNAQLLLVLGVTKSLFQAALVYVIDRQGTVQACTPYDQGQTLTGQNYSFRPYFIRAMTGQEVTYPAMGVTTREPGVYFASPIYSADRRGQVGVVVCKVGLEDLTAILQAEAQPAAMVSPEGVIFASNQPLWRFRTAWPVSPESLDKINQTRQFGSLSPTPLSVRLDQESVAWEGREHLVLSEPLSLAGWRVITLRALIPAALRLDAGQRRMVLEVGGLLSILSLLVLVLLISQDRRRRIEAALALAKSRLEGILDGAHRVAIIATDAQGVITAFNTGAERILGYRAEEMVGLKSVETFHLAEEIEARGRDLSAETGREVKGLDVFAEVVRQGGYEEREWTYVCRDGSRRRVILNVTAIRDAAGQISGFLGVAVDVTERRQALDELRRARDELELRVAERTAALTKANQELSLQIAERLRVERDLRKSEEAYRLILEALPDSVTITRRGDGAYVYANSAFYALAGYSSQEVLGRTIHELDFFADPVARRRLLDDVSQHGAVDSVEVRFRVKEGRIVTTLLSSRVIHYQGQPCHISVVKDITLLKEAEEEKKRLEAQLRHAQKMEAVGTLAGGIAHDFNNILQAVSGYVQLLLVDPLAEQTRRRYLDQINQAVERAAELIRGLLTFSRKVEPELRLSDLNEVVTQAVRMLKRVLPKMIKVETTLSEGALLVLADSIQMEQVLMNLGTNARDAMEQGGVLTMTTSRVVIEPGQPEQTAPAGPGRWARLLVGDTGHGMDEETRQRIFEPFFTTKGLGDGTGLGLSTAYGIIHAHGGRMSCASRPGQGTTFEIYLPLAERAEQPATPSSRLVQDLPTGTERLLLVDDERSIREIAQDALGRQGYEVLTAASGEEALEVYQRERGGLDLVILDLGMPGMGGHRCLAELRRLDPTLRVLVASGYSAQGQIKETLSAGAAGYITKPYRLFELLTKVRELLG